MKTRLRRAFGSLRRWLARKANRIPPFDPQRRSPRVGVRPLAKFFVLIERPDLATLFARRLPKTAKDVPIAIAAIHARSAPRFRTRDVVGVIAEPHAPPSALWDEVLAWPNDLLRESGVRRTIVAEGMKERPDLVPADWRSPEMLLPRLAADLDAAEARARGAITNGEFDRVVDGWSAFLGDDRARNRLVRLLVQAGDFTRARSSAWPHGPSDPKDFRSVDPSQADARVSDWLFVVHAELLAYGDVDSSQRVKELIADIVIDAPIRADADAYRWADRLRAVSYRHGPDKALAEVRALSRRRTRLEQMVFQRLEADLLAAAGDPAMLQSQRRAHDSATPLAQQRFERAVQQGSVLVVGPTAFDSDPTGFDVVVTTKRRWIDHEQTTVSFPSDASARLDETATADSLGLSTKHLISLRPSMLSWPGLRRIPSDRVRVAQHEDSNTFLGTHFGIQRIIYELIASAAKSITLAGCDFFLNEVPYFEGYSNEITDIYRPNDFRVLTSIAPHDHVSDFMMTKRVLADGLISATPRVSEILDLSRREYEASLQAVLARGRDG